MVGVDLGRDERGGVAERARVEDRRELAQHAGVLDLRDALAHLGLGDAEPLAEHGVRAGRSSGKSHWTALSSSRSRSSSSVGSALAVTACSLASGRRHARARRRAGPEIRPSPAQRRDHGRASVALHCEPARAPAQLDHDRLARVGRGARAPSRRSIVSTSWLSTTRPRRRRARRRVAAGPPATTPVTVGPAGASITVDARARRARAYPFVARSSAIGERGRDRHRVGHAASPTGASTMPVTSPVASTSAPPDDAGAGRGGGLEQAARGGSASPRDEAVGRRDDAAAHPGRRSPGLRRAHDPHGVAGPAA